MTNNYNTTKALVSDRARNGGTKLAVFSEKSTGRMPLCFGGGGGGGGGGHDGGGNCDRTVGQMIAGHGGHGASIGHARWMQGWCCC